MAERRLARNVWAVTRGRDSAGAARCKCWQIAFVHALSRPPLPLPGLAVAPAPDDSEDRHAREGGMEGERRERDRKTGVQKAW